LKVIAEISKKLTYPAEKTPRRLDIRKGGSVPVKKSFNNGLLPRFCSTLSASLVGILGTREMRQKK